MKRFILSMFLVGIVVSGCSNNNAEDWKESPTFTKENMTFYGTEGKFGVVKANGEADEPEFPADQGRLYRIYFLEDNDKFHGQDYQITAVHQDSEETINLVKQEVDNDNEDQAKFGLDQAGFWKIVVTIGNEPYTDFIIEAK